MYLCDPVFHTDKEVKDFVDAAEKRYIDQILDIKNEIKEQPNIKFLTLSGPTCSGKTTTSYILEKELEKVGITVKIISIDDFYRDHDDIFDDEEPDYESITAIDFDKFSECVGNILRGEVAYLPIFDFHKGIRTGIAPYTPSDHEIVIFEGIQAIYPEIVSTLPRELSRSIYICVDEDVDIFGTHFSRREVRFFRRLVRDFLFRNASPRRTLNLWDGVVQNEEKNIIPYGHKADHVINSFLSYELCAIKPYLLETVKYNMNDSLEKELYEELRSKFLAIPTISERFIPSDSVFREFIG